MHLNFLFQKRMAADIPEMTDHISERQRLIAEELLKDMPDMKREIQLQLGLNKSEIESTMPGESTGNNLNIDQCNILNLSTASKSNNSYKNSLEELKRFRLIRKCGDYSQKCTDNEPTGQPTTTKQIKLEEVDAMAVTHFSEKEIDCIDNHLDETDQGKALDIKHDMEAKVSNSIKDLMPVELIIAEQKRAVNQIIYSLTNDVPQNYNEVENTQDVTLIDSVEDSFNNTTTAIDKINHEDLVMASNRGEIDNISTKEPLEPGSFIYDESSNVSGDCESNLPPEKLNAQEEEHDLMLRASKATFLQHLPCFKLSGRVPKCRECRRRNVERQTANNDDVYCRFYEFRRLQYNENGELIVSGFLNPYTEPTQEDLNIWQPDESTEPTAGFMDIQVCRYILLHAGDQFCYLWRQEAEALKLHENHQNNTIAWKKIVKGIREICDVCDTTLFNFHWTCDKCGFGVCLDCFKDRKEQRNACRKMRTSQQRGRDEFYWLLCNSTQKHQLNELMLTQIIAGDALNVLGKMLHHVRAVWQVPQVCGCLLSLQKLPSNADVNILIQDMIKESQLKQQTSASSLATEETNRKQAKMEQLHCKRLEFARAMNIDYVPGRVWTKETLDKDPITSAFDNFKHINFHRKGLAGLRRFLPPRSMNTGHSSLLAPGVPHEWLCDGKLLRLTNAMHPDNRILFQEVWKCGQPVMISEVARSLNLDLWRPEAFCHDFGEKPNDLINCLNGNLVPNQPMRHFWEGFQCIKRRLLDANGKPMLLKLKDWPPGDDFAEILPTRFADLMKGLPMPEYTLRSGNLNIASCLPKMFVPPDLGPKMYNAYGSALHPDKGTTNLHLDISDAVNIMVYVGIPEDTDCKIQLTATQRAIEQGGCDYITRARSISKNVLPGALWHIFPARDADKIRDLLNRVTLEKGFRLEPDHDPIHDQNWYLDDKLRARLFKEYGVEGYPIVQCLGDAVFIPAGAPHQVQNLHNCIKVAEDFVSPENITHCYHLTHEFRRLSHSHTNHEDKLQIKNIIYHAIKDCCNILMRALEQKIKELDGQ